MTARPRVSIIMAVHNAAPFVETALASVYAQSYPHIELIVVDDGSTDATPELLTGHRARCLVLRQPHTGVSAARNRGLRSATGDYVGFLDADDLMAGSKVAEQVAYLEAHPQADLVVSRIRLFRGADPYPGHPAKRWPRPTDHPLAELAWGNPITTGAPLLRRELIATGVGFDESLARHEDWDFWLRLAAAGARFGWLDREHLHYRLHPYGVSRRRLAMYRSKWLVACRAARRLAPELLAADVAPAAMYAYHLADYGRALISCGRVRRGRQLITAAARTPFPQRRLFTLFARAAAVVDHRLLDRLQRLVSANNEI